jgi:hypothetical protein
MRTYRTRQASTTPDHPVTRRVTLTDHAMLTLQPRPGQWLRIDEGTVHLTRNGLPQDVFLVAGRRWPIQSPGSVLVEALGPVRLVLTRPASRRERVRSALRAIAATLARTAQRTARRVRAGGRILL